MPLNAHAVSSANAQLWKAHPELAGRQLTSSPDDALLRDEWLKNYKRVAASENPSLKGSLTSVDKASASDTGFGYKTVNPVLDCNNELRTCIACRKMLQSMEYAAQKRLAELNLQAPMEFLKPLQTDAIPSFHPSPSTGEMKKDIIRRQADDINLSMLKVHQYDTTLEKAKLCEAVYCDTAPPGWYIMRVKEDRDTGFKATWYTSGTGDRNILVFQGTNPSDTRVGGDWVENIEQTLEFITPQYEAAMDLAQTGSSRIRNLEIIGHSLGGGLAAAGAIVSGKHATTFNAAGVSEVTLARRGRSRADGDNLVDNYHVEGEMLTLIQTYSRADAAVGRQHSLADCRGGFHPVNKHSMHNVIHALAAQKQDQIELLRKQLGLLPCEKDLQCHVCKKFDTTTFCVGCDKCGGDFHFTEIQLKAHSSRCTGKPPWEYRAQGQPAYNSFGWHFFDDEGVTKSSSIPISKKK